MMLKYYIKLFFYSLHFAYYHTCFYLYSYKGDKISKKINSTCDITIAVCNQCQLKNNCKLMQKMKMYIEKIAQLQAKYNDLLYKYDFCKQEIKYVKEKKSISKKEK